MTQGIFISYRREDAAGYAGRLYDRLAAHFGADRVFMDVEGIEPGVDFVDAIERAVASCELLIVIIGNDWLSASAAGKRRLDDPADFVRIETAAALARGIRVVPVLVESAAMPRADQLPPDLAPLVRRQAVELSHKQWDATSGELIRTLEKILDGNKHHDAVAEAGEGGRSSAPQGARRGETAGDVATEISTGGHSGGGRYVWIAAAIVLAIAAVAAYVMQPWKQTAKPSPKPGHLAVSPVRIDFPDQPQHVAGSPASITLTNEGESPLRVGTPTLDGAVTDFSLRDDTCTGRTLAAGASCSIRIAFTAQGVGARSASLTFPSDAPMPVVVALQGRGEPPAVSEIARAPEKSAVTPPAEKSTPAPAEKSTPTAPEPPPRSAPPAPRTPDVAAAAPRILSFETILANGTAQLCYGVENAATATILPSPGPIKALPKGCVPVGDAGRYTLTARNAAGVAVSRTLSYAPQAPPPAPATATVAIPNAIGKSQADAIADLEKAGLEVRVVESGLDPAATGAAGTVVAQLPKAGEPSKAGARVTLQVAPASAAATATPTMLPRVGDTWDYRFRSIWKNVEPRVYSHQVSAVSDREVRETMTYASGGDKTTESKSFGPDTRFVEWRGKGYAFVEFNPFIDALGGLKPGIAWKSIAMPADDPFFGNWSTSGRAVDSSQVTVPAGTFKAIRVELNSNRAPTGSASMRTSEPVRILQVIWYAPEVKRAVKLVRTVYNTSGNRLDEDTYELVKFRVQ